MEPHNIDLQQLAQSVEILRNLVYIIGAVGGLTTVVAGYFLRANYMPRKEIEAQRKEVEAELHSIRNKIVTGDSALRLLLEGTEKTHGAELDAVNKALAQHEIRLTEVQGHFAVLDGAIKALPTEGSINGLAVAIEGLRGDVRVVFEKVSGAETSAKVTAQQVNRIDDYLRRKEAAA